MPIGAPAAAGTGASSASGLFGGSTASSGGLFGASSSGAGAYGHVTCERYEVWKEVPL